LALTDRALAFCRLPPGAVVADVGCGTGAAAEHLRERHGLRAVGLDPSRSLLAEGRRRAPGRALIQGQAQALPLVGGRLDAVLCECVLSLTGAPEGVLAEFHRVLRPGGWLVVSDLYAGQGPPGPAISASGGGCLEGAMARRTLEAHVTRAGFRIRLWEDHTPLLTHFAAQLLLAGEDLEALRPSLGRGHSAGGHRCRPRPGYFLLVARRGEG
jgi:ubiquinone/menaquinone biosynthesis C-methylase UbiE